MVGPVDIACVSDWAPPDDPLGAFCRDNHVSVKGSGRGPLAGLTFAVKDLFDIAGSVTGFGHPDWLRTHEPAISTATAVQQLLDAGADMVGKTYTDELAYSLTGENVHYGTPVNSRDPARVPGGSSNGSAAAVAGNLVDFAVGSDCGGSIRLPASYCGLLGIRPTHGRVSLEGAIPFGPSFDVAGWFAREPDIFEKVGGVLLDGKADPTPPRRAVVVADGFDMLECRARAALKPAVEASGELIGITEDIRISPQGLASWFETFRVLQAAEIWANHGAWIEATRPKLGPGIRERFEWAAAVTPAQVARAQTERQAIVRHVDRLIAPGDVLCMPTSPRIAPLRNTPVDKIEIEYRHQAMHLLCVSGLCGLPQISLPLVELDGMPFGLSILGRRGADEMLLGVARQLMAGR